MCDPLVPLRGFRHAADVKHGPLPDADGAGRCRWCGRRIESTSGNCPTRGSASVYVLPDDPGVSPADFRP